MINMGKSLSDYNIERSSSVDVKNIKWTQKNPVDPDKPKKKNTKQTSPINIILAKNTKTSSNAQKIFKIEGNASTSKKNNTRKRSQNSSLSNCKIEQGYERPAR